MSNNQRSGDDSTNFQANRDITVNYPATIVMYSFEEMAKHLQLSVFGGLPDETKKQSAMNQQSYSQVLSGNLNKIIKQGAELKKVIDSIDFQYIAKKAGISAIRSSSIELQKSLSLLIVQRINNDDEELRRIVFNEAIETIDKLTVNQQKQLALCLLMTRVTIDSLTDIKKFIEFIEKKVLPLLDYNESAVDLMHLTYTGCVSKSSFSMELDSLLTRKYPHIFYGDITAKKKLADNEVWKKLRKVWSTTQIKHMDLTPVGIVIAVTFLEQITGIKINIDSYFD